MRRLPLHRRPPGVRRATRLLSPPHERNATWVPRASETGRSLGRHLLPARCSLDSGVWSSVRFPRTRSRRPTTKTLVPPRNSASLRPAPRYGSNSRGQKKSAVSFCNCSCVFPRCAFSEGRTPPDIFVPFQQFSAGVCRIDLIPPCSDSPAVARSERLPPRIPPSSGSSFTAGRCEECGGAREGNRPGRRRTGTGTGTRTWSGSRCAPRCPTSRGPRRSRAAGPAAPLGRAGAGPSRRSSWCRRGRPAARAAPGSPPPTEPTSVGSTSPARGPGASTTWTARPTSRSSPPMARCSSLGFG